jgi:membrane protease YdiL (CAAX protease family)
MNENQEPMNNDLHPDPLLAEKAQETAILKRILNILAICVIATIVCKRILGDLIFSGFEYLFENIENLPEWLSSLLSSWDFGYFLLWLSNDIVVYLPPLLIFGFALKSYMGHKADGYYKTETRYVFRKIWLIPIFFGSYTLSIAMSFLSHLIAAVLEPVFGGGGLPDIFGDVMPQSEAQVYIAIFSIGIVAGVCEELIYRHYLLRPLRRFGDVQAVVITALLFGFFHANFTQFLYTTAVGFIYGIVAVKANSVLPAMVLHIVNNTYVVLYGEAHKVAEAQYEADGSTLISGLLNMWFWVMLVGGLLMLIFMWAKGHFKLQNQNSFLTNSERARMTVENPLILLMIIVLIVITVQGTMR